MIFTRNELLKQDAHVLVDIILDLKEQLNWQQKNSQNSSKPPSSDTKTNVKRNQSLRKKTGLKPGGQKGHQGHYRELSKVPDEIHECIPDPLCEQCGSTLNFDSSCLIEKRQEFDIPKIKPKVTEYQKRGVLCYCGHVNKGSFPKHVKATVQIGTQMKAFLTYLNVRQLIPYNRLAELSRDLFNFPICKRSIENYLEEAATLAYPHISKIISIIKSCKWVGSDETGQRVEGKRCWEWVWQNNEASYYAVSQSRGYQVVQEHFGEDYRGSLVHDCWSAHNNTIAKSGHQQCHPHIQRDLQFLILSYNSAWAYHFNTFLSASQKARDIIWADGFPPDLRDDIIQSTHLKLLKFCVKDSENKEILKLQKRIIKHQDSILHFMKDPDIPFHNNSSEQAIRMAKVKQKISGGFRSKRGAERQSILLSVIETAKKQNMNTLETIKKLFSQSLTFRYI